MIELSDTLSAAEANRNHYSNQSVSMHMDAKSMFADAFDYAKISSHDVNKNSSHNQALIEQSRGIFGQNMGQSDRTNSDGDSLLDALKAGATELVATTFIQPMFAMLRSDPLRSDLFPESSGEKMFGPMLDAELAKKIVSSGNLPLTDAVVRQLQILDMHSQSVLNDIDQTQNLHHAYDVSHNLTNVLGDA